MRKNVWLVLGLGFALVSGRAALADVWDVQTQNDNAVGTTENELVHGSDQLHDLGAIGPNADQDWYRLSQKPFSSYEIVADATSGDIGTTLNVLRTNATGAPIQTSVPVGVGYSRSLRWINATSASEDTQRIEVTSGSCTTNCGADDVYRLRAYETTYAVPRFNNLGSQITVLLLQNPTNYTIIGHGVLLELTGASLGTPGLHARAEGAARAQHVDGHGCQRRDDHRARRSLRRSVGQERRSGAVDRLQLRHSGAPPDSLSPGRF